MESLRIILESAGVEYPPEERQRLTDEKNALYQSMLAQLGPRDVLPGGWELLAKLRAAGIHTAVASSSRNGRAILTQVQLLEAVDVIVDGNDITRSKPDPEVFLLAAERLGIPPSACVVVEDAVSGLEAAHRAGMRAVAFCAKLPGTSADLSVHALSEIDVPTLRDLANNPQKHRN
jgi:beta-phosphoglucomutase